MNKNDKGFNILISLLNNGQFSSFVDINQPDDDTCKSFALLLNLMEKGKIYEVILAKIQNLYKDPQYIETINKVFQYKKNLDNNFDGPAVHPRDVFRRPE